jgi:hypothetical protein
LKKDDLALKGIPLLQLKEELFSNKLFEGIESIVKLHPCTKELILEEQVY